MDEGDQGQHWIARSPYPYPSRQPAPPFPGASGIGSSSEGTMGRQYPRERRPHDHRWDSSGGQAPYYAQDQKPGPSSQTTLTKRQQRSSSFDEEEHRGHERVEGEAGGRDIRPPPTRRRRIEPYNSLRTYEGSFPPANAVTIEPTSWGPSPQVYRALQDGPAGYEGHGQGGGIDYASYGSSSSQGPFHQIPFGNQGDRGYNRDVTMRSAALPRYQQFHQRGFVGRGELGSGQDHPSSGLRDWDASRVQDGVSGTWNNPRFLGAAHQGLSVNNYGPSYNIGNAENVFAGINHGNVYMGSFAIRPEDEFMTTLANRLKICVRADHKYYADGDESALRRGQCTPGTRIDIIQGVTHWATNISPFSEPIFWLSGQAGAGKTTIAYTIALLFEAMVSRTNGRVILGGTFFCSRQFPDTRSASAIIRTIVYQLALRSKPFQMALKEYGNFAAVDHGPKSQLMGLLVEPWKMSAQGRMADDEPCYVLPIDALDELEGERGLEFLSVLLDVLEQQDLSGLKFFVTSRSHPALVKRIKSFSNKQVCRLEEVPLEQSSTDIELYLSQNLAECANTQQIQQLVADAAGLFIHAATVVEYLKGRDIKEQRSLLQGLLSNSLPPVRQPFLIATTTLDSLYLQILETSLVDVRDRNNAWVSQACLLILHTFLSTVERISISVAVSILNASSDQDDTVVYTGIAEGVLHRLHAVLYSQGGKIMWFHKSFVDFLFDESRSKRFFCNTEQFHHCLASSCFGIMSQQLRFNIADIPSSYQLDCEDSLLSSRIDTNISAALRYACGHWSAHVVLASQEARSCLVEILNKFLQLHILFWMEAMNLLGQRGHCEHMLRHCQQKFSKSNLSAELVSKLADAAAFAAHHSTSKASLSTPHLYISSLATFSRCSTVVQTWRWQFAGIPGFTSVQGPAGEALVTSIKMHSMVITLAISPDGINIAVGSHDGQVQIWDLSTGEEVRVLEGHTEWVDAVAYSPDGTHVISGSGDKSVRVWDLSTGEVVRVLEGHTDWVRAVAYSPDGTHVISGSDDNSARVWDLSTGEEVRVLEGHTKSVTAVAYSPDGTHVISGSGDESIRVWDLSTGEVVRVLDGHTYKVNAVAYSPDGTHVISGSDDNSVWVWDLSTGEVVRVLEGHTSSVWAVAYSPDGTHAISGSRDKSVRVWDLSTGEEVRVLEGHTNWVTAVAYSPDGTHVISGSYDKSVWVWDLSTGEVASVLEGHTDRVNAVAYSPDGTHCISGSADKSVWVWGALPVHDLLHIREKGSQGEYTGWLVSPIDLSAHLMYVRPELLPPDPSNVLTLPMSAASRVDFSCAKFGNNWAECYTPRPL